MPGQQSGDAVPQVTVLLEAVAAGDEAASERLMQCVYDELRALAHAQMRRERPGHVYQTTALAHEACARLLGDGPQDWKNRRYFFGAAARAMRRILAESPGRLRDDRLPRIVGDRDPAKDAAVDVALRKLEAFDPRKSEVVMLRFYLGMTVKEVADTLGLSPRTIDDDWCIARAWLRREIESGGGS